MNKSSQGKITLVTLIVILSALGLGVALSPTIRARFASPPKPTGPSMQETFDYFSKSMPLPEDAILLDESFWNLCRRGNGGLLFRNRILLDVSKTKNQIIDSICDFYQCQITTYFPHSLFMSGKGIRARKGSNGKVRFFGDETNAESIIWNDNYYIKINVELMDFIRDPITKRVSYKKLPTSGSDPAGQGQRIAVIKITFIGYGLHGEAPKNIPEVGLH